jgi:hypothetical protein
LPWSVSDASAEAFPFDLDPPIPMQQQFNCAEVGLDNEVETGVSVTRLSDAADCSQSDYFSAFERRPASRNAILDTPSGTLLDFDWIDMWTSRIPFLQFEEHLKLQGTVPIHGMKKFGLYQSHLVSRNSHQPRHPLSASSTTSSICLRMTSDG